MTGDAELLRLAREGEARRIVAVAEEAVAARLGAIRERREVRRLCVPDLLDALAERPRYGTVPLFRWASAALIVSALLLVTGRMAALGLLGVIATPIVYFGARRWIALRAWWDERAWLHALPFPVPGYFALLCTPPRESRTVRVRFRLRDEGPGEEVVRGLAGRIGGAVQLSRRRDAWEIESGPIRSLETDEIKPTNGPLLAWMRAAIDEALLPLHAAYPITSVRFLE